MIAPPEAEAEAERSDPHPQLSEPMERLSYSDVPPGFEQFKLIKGSSSSSSSFDHKPPPTPAQQDGRESGKQEEPPNVKDDATTEKLYKLSIALRRLFREFNGHLKSVCNITPPDRPRPYNNTVDHLTALLLHRTSSMGSNVHVKRVCLTQKVFDPLSLPTSNPTPHIEWFITQDHDHQDYIFQLARKPQPPVSSWLHPTVVGSSSKEFTPDPKNASIITPTPTMLYPKHQLIWPQQQIQEYITALKGKSTANIVVDATPISYVKANEQIVRSVKNEKEFITGLKGASTTKIVLDATPVSCVKTNGQSVQNEKEFIAKLKGESTTKKILNPTPLSYVKPNERIVRLQNDEEAAASKSESGRVHDVEPISYMYPDEHIVQPMGNELVVSQNDELSGNKTIKVPTERIGWMEADFKIPYNVVDITGMDLNKLIIPDDLSAGTSNLNREFCFAERLANWFVEVRCRDSGKHDIYYYHRQAPKLFRSTKEVMKFIMYEAYPRRPSNKTNESENFEKSSKKRKGPSSNGGDSKRRKKNQLVVYENEAILTKSVDETIIKWMSSSSGAGGDKGGEETTKWLVDQAKNSPSKKQDGKATIKFPVNANDEMCDENLQHQGNKSDGEATDKFLVNQAMNNIICNPCLAAQGNNDVAYKVKDMNDLMHDETAI